MLSHFVPLISRSLVNHSHFFSFMHKLIAIFSFSGDMVLRPSWGKDQPNNYNGEQNCVVLDGGRGWLWNDVGCNLDYLHWICQHSK